FAPITRSRSKLNLAVRTPRRDRPKRSVTSEKSCPRRKAWKPATSPRMRTRTLTVRDVSRPSGFGDRISTPSCVRPGEGRAAVTMTSPTRRTVLVITVLHIALLDRQGRDLDRGEPVAVDADDRARGAPDRVGAAHRHVSCLEELDGADDPGSSRDVDAPVDVAEHIIRGEERAVATLRARPLGTNEAHRGAQNVAPGREGEGGQGLLVHVLRQRKLQPLRRGRESVARSSSGRTGGARRSLRPWRTARPGRSSRAPLAGSTGRPGGTGESRRTLGSRGPNGSVGALWTPRAGGTFGSGG